MQSSLERFYLRLPSDRSKDRVTPSLKLSSSSIGSRLGDSFGYSAQFVDDIEKQHEETLHGVADRKLSMQRNHTRITESLKKQLEALKQQADFNAQTQLRETNALRESFEINLQGRSQEQDGVERSLTQQLSAVQGRLEETRAKNSRLKQDDLDERLRHEEDISSLHAKVRGLLQEKERLQTKVIDAGRLEIERLEQYQGQLKEQHAEAIRSLREDFEGTMEAVRLQIEERQRQIKRTEKQLNQGRREHILKSETTEREVQTMQSKLQEMREVIEDREQELEKVQAQHVEAVKEGMIFKKEAALLANEVKRIRGENRDITEEVLKLERLVYGKDFPSPSNLK
jgi:chromosome segregation ATPase